MRWIKDSIHGDVFISTIADAIIETPTMQRLRRVVQTSFSNLLYPGANHTRFEHSIGTYFLTSRGCFLNNVPKDQGTRLVLAGLLHDVGHSAFSHALEGVVEKYMGKDHEDYSRELITNGEIAGILDKHGIEPKSIASVYDEPVGKFILGYLGTDKMDYLLRDSHYTGVAYGAVDADRILRKVVIKNDGVHLEEKGISAAEAMLMARFLMYSNVYMHHVAVSAGAMIERAAEDAIAHGALKPEELSTMDDWQLMGRLEQAGGQATELARRLKNRRIYKAAAQRKMKDFKNWLYLGELGEDDLREAEAEIAAKAGIRPEEVIICIPAPWFMDVGIQVIKNGDYYSLEEASLITRLLKEAQWDYLNVMALCPEEHRSAVEAVGLSVLESYGGE